MSKKKIEPKSLESLMADAGLGERTRTKLRKANEIADESPAQTPAPRGRSGSTSMAQPVVDEL